MTPSRAVSVTLLSLAFVLLLATAGILLMAARQPAVSAAPTQPSATPLPQLEVSQKPAASPGGSTGSVRTDPFF